MMQLLREFLPLQFPVILGEAGITMGAALSLLHARKGTGASFMVGVSSAGDVTIPAGTNLEDGIYLISHEAGGPQIARFLVVAGVTGKALATTAPEDVIRFVLRLKPQSQAEKLDDLLHMLEATLDAVQGKPCRKCGEMNTFEAHGIDPQKAIDAYNAHIAHFAEHGLVDALGSIMFDTDTREALGYTTAQEVLDHKRRVEDLMERPIDVPATEEAPVPAS